MDLTQHILNIKTLIRELTPQETSRKITADNSTTTLIDLREADETATGIIAEAHCLPRGLLEFKISKICPNLDQEIILYCAGGNRSIFAAKTLKDLGYNNVFSMTGGIQAWKDQGLTLSQSQQLTALEHARYARHVSLPDVGTSGQRQLIQSKVLIVGAGGLGSPCALYLAAAGIGTIGLIDADIVDISNLQRQILHSEINVGKLKVDSAKSQLQQINSSITILTHACRLDATNALEILASYDIIVNGCDNFATRYLVNDACVLLGKPMIDGAIFRMEGCVTVYDSVHGGPCYRCLYPEPPPAEMAPNCDEAGVIGVLPGIIGTLQASEVIKLCLKLGKPLIGRMLMYSCLDQSFREFKTKRNSACAICGDHASITTLHDVTRLCASSISSDHKTSA